MNVEQKTTVTTAEDIRKQSNAMMRRILNLDGDFAENSLGSTRYKRPVSYVKKDIYEYDIAKANISVLHSMGVINDHEYERLKSLDRQDRQVTVGRMQEYDKVLRIALQEAFTQCRRQFVRNNNFTLEDILIINTDAIYTLRQADNPVINDDIGFVLKNQYQLYIHCLNLDILYSHGSEDAIDIKGINDTKLGLHQKYIFKICQCLGKVMDGDIDGAIEFWIQFSEQYNQRALPIEYYRELNSGSMYRYTNGCGSDTAIAGECLNIGFNVQWNQKFFSILSQMYFNHTK